MNYENLLQKEEEKLCDSSFIKISQRIIPSIEDEKWEIIKTIKNKIENLYFHHEMTSTQDLKLMVEIKRFSNERKKKIKENELIRKEKWENLFTYSIEDQIHFFIDCFGPKKSLDEYYNWKYIQDLASVTTNYSNGVQRFYNFK